MGLETTVLRTAPAGVQVTAGTDVPGLLRTLSANLAGAECQLLIPEQDVADPELSIVIPAMNERITIAQFVEWCKEGLAKAGVAGEILIVDSSSDETPAVALAHGARVLRTPKRGLGRAYIDSIPYIRGRYVLMGDADCTYDFREISGFLLKFRAGFQFVMGSRFGGYIEDGSMPALHRYFGTPLTTWILNRLYGTSFTDIHCGMRGITREALETIELESQSWEYASEMVLKSVCFQLPTAEVPVRFLKDQEGRLSHMKRGGWLEPWRAGWINLRAMLLYGADYFLLRPGLAAAAAGLALTLPVTLGPVPLGPVTLSLYWMLLGLTLAVAGVQSFFLGCIVQTLYAYTPEAARRWTRAFPYDRGMILSGGLLAAGIALAAPLAAAYVQQGLRLASPGGKEQYMAITGLLAVALSFVNFCSTLVLHAVSMRTRVRPGWR
ncbi:MAG: glycosyltransferase family 2 protein [Acidobacteria bacterium]|nr:glycosyltransferase family 2 protein [Acidobacteriota bacterium]